MSIDRLNPKIDFMFRKLFGSEENKDLLISLLNSVLQDGVEPSPPIVDVTLKNPFNLAGYPGDKSSILDIKAVDQNGTWYDIEMQVEAHSLYGRRAVYYLSKTYADQLDSGEDYSHLNTAIGIHFLDFKYFDDERVLHQFVFKDTQTNDAPVQLDCVRLYFIELPKFEKGWSEVVTALERWVAFLNRVGLDAEALPKELTQDVAVARAVEVLDRSGLSESERLVYEGEERRRMIDAVQIRDAVQRGVQLGREEGVQLGREEGVQLGREEGVQLGEQKALSRSLVRQLTRRLGEIPSSIAVTLQSLNADALDELDLALPDLHSYADVEQWLTRSR